MKCDKTTTMELNTGYESDYKADEHMKEEERCLPLSSMQNSSWRGFSGLRQSKRELRSPRRGRMQASSHKALLTKIVKLNSALFRDI